MQLVIQEIITFNRLAKGAYDPNPESEPACLALGTFELVERVGLYKGSITDEHRTAWTSSEDQGRTP